MTPNNTVTKYDEFGCHSYFVLYYTWSWNYNPFFSFQMPKGIFGKKFQNFPFSIFKEFGKNMRNFEARTEENQNYFTLELQQ